MNAPSHIRAMLEPSFYTHETIDIHLIQTHISWVILTGRYVYKVKKPVDFGFLDFSTLDKRQAMCRKELELNRRLAPELYLEVLPICKSGENFRLGTERDCVEVVDYCLKMTQFDPQALLAHEIERNNCDPLWMDQLARQIAEFHTSAQVTHDPRFGNAAALDRYIGENLHAAMELGRYPGYPDLRPVLEQGASRMLQELTPRIEQRRPDGFIRACHGDLHLGNIALVRGKPRVFDCIEFNDELRLIDTMNDIAFLTMDCDAKARPELGMRFLSRYLEHNGDYPGLALLRLYQFYRAGVRGKVALLLSKDADIPEPAAETKRREALHYFELAISYCTPRHRPRLYAIGGLSGSGKSHLALLGSQEEHALVIRSDATRKRLGAETASLYTSTMTQATYVAMMAGADAALAAGLPVILDATFLDRTHRDMTRELAQTHGVPLHLFWLDPPASELRRRIRNRSSAGTDISDADLAVLESQLADYRRPEEADIRFLPSSDRWPYITSTA